MEDIEASWFWVPYFGSLALVATWESVAPRRRLAASLSRPWLGNAAFKLMNLALARWLVPISGVALAGSAVADTWGLLSHLDSPLWLAAVLSVLALDLNRYAQHIALHRVPWLWRVHRLHHSDLDCDVTTQWRFHPFESVFSVGCFSLFIVGLGLPPEGVFLHAVLVGVLGFIQHGNVRYPRGLDVAATTLIVTPDMHRIHHSALQRESNGCGLHLIFFMIPD